jgi:hypothetical protein
MSYNVDDELEERESLPTEKISSEVGRKLEAFSRDLQQADAQVERVSTWIKKSYVQRIEKIQLAKSDYNQAEADQQKTEALN